MKSRAIAFFSLMACLCFFCYGCVSEPTDEAAVKSSASNEAGSQEESVVPAARTIQDVIGTKGAYCLAHDGTVDEGGLLDTKDYELGNGKVAHDIYVYGSEPLLIDRSKGDSLIVVGDLLMSDEDEVDSQAPTDKYYWSGSELDASEIEEFNGEKIGKPLSDETNIGNLGFFLNQTIEPMGFKYFPNFLTDREGIIVSDEPSTYSYGYYEGTSWNEKKVTTSKPYYDYSGLDRDGDEYVAPVVRGKEGYFVIDVSNIPAGTYVYEFSNRGMFYAFEIK